MYKVTLLLSIAGGHRFKGAKRATPYAAQFTVKRAKEHGVKTVSIRVREAGAQRESTMLAVFG